MEIADYDIGVEEISTLHLAMSRRRLFYANDTFCLHSVPLKRWKKSQFFFYDFTHDPLFSKSFSRTMCVKFNGKGANELRNVNKLNSLDFYVPLRTVHKFFNEKGITQEKCHPILACFNLIDNKYKIRC